MDVFEPVPPGVLEYPLVQYIPLPVRTLLEVAAPPAPPALAHLADPAALERVCDALGVVTPVWDARRLTLLVTGVRTSRCYYRAEKALLLGATRPGLVQVVSLSRQRIYKDRVAWVIFDTAGAELCRCYVSGAKL